MRRNKIGGRNRVSARPPAEVKLGALNLVDQLRKGEQELAELLPLTSAQAIPASRTPEGKIWRAQEAAGIRKRIAKLTNSNLYPLSVTARAKGMLRAFENRVVAQGHDRWWVTNQPPQKKRKGPGR